MSQIKVTSLKTIRGTELKKNSKLDSTICFQNKEMFLTTPFSKTASPQHTFMACGWDSTLGDFSQPLLQVLDVGTASVPSATLGAALQELHFEGQLCEFEVFAFLPQMSLGRCAGAVQCAGGGRAGDPQGVAVRRTKTGQQAERVPWALGNQVIS